MTSLTSQERGYAIGCVNDENGDGTLDRLRVTQRYREPDIQQPTRG
jgi:hypothetical protein